jgi:hypothetical protein
MRPITGEIGITHQNQSTFEYTEPFNLSTHNQHAAGALKAIFAAQYRYAIAAGNNGSNFNVYNIGFDSVLLGDNYNGADTHPRNVSVRYLIRALP